MDLILDEHPQSEEEVQFKRVFWYRSRYRHPSCYTPTRNWMKPPVSQPRRTWGGSPSSFAVLQLPRRESGTKAQPKLTAKPHVITAGPMATFRYHWKTGCCVSRFAAENLRGKADTRIKCNHPMPASEATDSRVRGRGCKFAAKTGEHAFRDRMSSVWTACSQALGANI